MRVSTVPVQAPAQVTGLRGARPPAGPAAMADLATRLPGAVADRLAVLMARDPGLAAAVSARLPEARATSARDLAAYGSPAPRSTIDIRS